MTPEQDGLTPVRADMVLDPNGNVIARLDGSTDAWPVPSDPQWRVYQKNIKEYLVEVDHKESERGTSIAGVTEQTEATLIERIEPQESPRGHQRFWQKAAQGIGVLLFAAGLGIGGVKLADSQGSQPTPTAVPQGIQERLPQGFQSAQDEYKQRVKTTPIPTPEAKSKEVKIQTITNPIEFTYGGDQFRWFFDNARHGIYPPNDPSKPTGTTDVYKNNQYQESFQPLRSLVEQAEGVSKDGIAGISVGGNIVDTQTIKGYQAVIYETAEGRKLAIFTLRDALNPTDYSKGAQVVINQGLEDMILEWDLLGSFYLSGEQGTKRINFEVIYAFDPAKNGKYSYSLDSKGYPVPPPVKLAEVTPTPTPAEFKIWLPLVSKRVVLPPTWLTPVGEPVSPASRQ